MNYNDLGLAAYDDALAVQLGAVEEALQGGEEQVYLLEHYPVITLGRNHSSSNLLADEDLLRSKNIQLIKTSRGGDITCHFPGQLVVYPVMRMEKRPGGIKFFFHSLEQVVINLLSHYNIDSWRVEGMTGVFTRGGKIASMGIAVKKWISYHGIALNLARDLSLFEYINPCGLKKVNMTSVHRELNSEHPDMKSLKNDFCREFSRKILLSRMNQSLPHNKLDQE
jgi:lipoyl(octanoyl) transferase